MTASDRRWLSAIYTLGALSAVIFALLKSSAFMRSLRDDAHVFGDLYDFARIEQFRTPLPAWVPPVAELRAADAASADLIAVGDSFLRTAHGAEAIVDQIARELGCRVYSVPLAGDPAHVLRGSAVPDRRRVLLLESAEHQVLPRFAKKWQRHVPRTGGQAPWLAIGLDLRRRWFIASERNCQYFVRNWPLTRTLYDAWSELRFAWLREISNKTPAYSVAPEPMLFYEQELCGPTASAIRGFYQPRSDSDIAAVVENLVALAKELREEHQVELVFMPVPSKYSVYYERVDADATYDDFLPRLCQELKRRGVATIDLYREFRRETEAVYWPSDTHWNPRGAAIACARFVDEVHARGWLLRSQPAPPARAGL
ncbi:MAG: alginate O-acetyltransferase AlgX-related protein [Planctomycetota bacterium]